MPTTTESILHRSVTLSAPFNINTRNWLEVDFSRWGKCAFDNSKFEILKTAVIQCKEIFKIAFILCKKDIQ
jgi:hypothetical protein